MKEKRFLSLLILLTTFSLSAQVKGVVLDSISGKPVAYVGVFTSKPELNFSTDKKGKFKEDNLTKQDTLWFFTSGYQEKMILVKDFNKKILLNPITTKPEKKDNYIVTQKKNWIDFKSNNLGNMLSYTNTRLNAYFIQGIKSSNHKVMIDTLSLNITNITQKKIFFKVRFFKVGIQNSIKEEILLSKPLIFYVNPKQNRVQNNVYHSKKHNKIVLLNEQIEVPEEGIYIALEIVNIKNNILTIIENNTKINVVNPLISFTDIKTTVFRYDKGNWIKDEKRNYYPDFKISIATTQN